MLRHTAIATLGLLTLAAARPAIAQPDSGAAPDGDSELVDYVVQEGDTCIGIAKRELGGRAHLQDLHRANPGMGPTPHTLVPGTVLKLPGVRHDPGTPDARLTDKRGPVRVKEPAKELWERALRGMPLFRRWRVRSQERASAEVTFQDQSTIQMRENTVVVIYGPSNRATLQQVTTASLERGTLRTRLGELDRPATLIVNTPSAESRIERGSALVSADDRGTTRVANHEGKPVRVRSRRGRRAQGPSVQVAEGMGSRVEEGKSPTPPRPLPPTPSWVDGPRRFVGFADRGASVRGQWQPVAVATEYRIELAAAGEGGAAVSQIAIPRADIDRFEIHGLPPGQYRAVVSAIDADGFESKPSDPVTLTVAAVELHGLSTPAGAALDPDADAPGSSAAGEPEGDDDALGSREPPAVRVAVQGSTVVAPAGLSCALAGDAEAGPAVVLARTGRHEIRCRDAQGEALAPVTVQVDELVLRVVDPGGGAPAPLPRGGTGRVRVEVASAGVAPAALALRAPAALQGLRVGPTEAAEGSFEADIDIPDGADFGPEIALQVIARSAPETVLTEISVAVAAPEPPEPPAPPPARAWEIGLFGGASLRSDRYELGRTLLNTGIVGDSPMLGLRAALSLHPRVFVEGELTLARVALDVPGTPSAGIYGYAAQARVLLPGWRRFAPFAVAGIGAHTLRTASPEVIDDTDMAVFYGLGATYPLSPRLAARVDARHVLSAGYDSFAANLFELTVGITWRPTAPLR
ncbi:FecR domain-containing protein [Haliangium sp.]|uniref:FecR domain-containing protein n=1 Tax=Haliangium sp. TaxID=2663208 RepID=UPI003D0C68F2